MTERDAFIMMLNFEEAKVENKSNKETSSTVENAVSKSVNERKARDTAQQNR